MSATFMVHRLENGLAVCVAGKAGDLPAASLADLRIGDTGVVLDPPSYYTLRPAAADLTITDVIASDRATWRWVETDAAGPIGATSTVTNYLGGRAVQRRPTATSLVCDSGGIKDYLIGVTDTSAPRTITLPPAQNCREIVVKDESLLANNPIIIQPLEPGRTVDGAPNVSINVGGGCFYLYSDGVNWFVSSQL